jgi:hypothetical protein
MSASPLNLPSQLTSFVHFACISIHIQTQENLREELLTVEAHRHSLLHVDFHYKKIINSTDMVGDSH